MVKNIERKDVESWRKYWSSVGDKYKEPWQSYGMARINKLEQRFIRDSINTIKEDTPNLLDIGIGNGRILDILLNQALMGVGKKVYGVDYAEEMVEFCSQKFDRNADLKELSVVNIVDEDIPFSKKWDGVTIIRVLKYLPSWKETVLKIAETMNDNGVIIFTLPNEISINRFAGLPGSIRRVSLKEVREFFSSEQCSRLTIEEIKGFSILPDALYRISIKPLVRVVYLLDRLLIKFFKNKFSRILFFRVRVVKE